MLGEVGGDPGVEHRHPGAGGPGDDVDRRPAGEEVGDHLRGHLGGVGAHPAGGDPVVAGADEHRAGAEGDGIAAAHRGEADGELLEPAQAAGGLGEVVLVPPCRLGGAGVGRCDPADGVLEDAHDASSRRRRGRRVTRCRPSRRVEEQPITTRVSMEASSARRQPSSQISTRSPGFTLEMWSSPSVPLVSSTKAPKVVVFTTLAAS